MVQIDPTPTDPTPTAPQTDPGHHTRRPSSDAPMHDDAGHARLIRSVAVTGLLVAFVMLASYIRPADSTALPELPRPNPTPYVAPGDDITTALGSLHGRGHVLEIVGTAAGVRYNVYDAEGSLILEHATPAQLEQIDPALNPNSMLGTPMGIVTDDDY